MGTVPIGTGELRRIHSRVSWIRLPVDRSMMVSAPHRLAQTILSTSSSIDEDTAELPMLALTLTRNRLPMIAGSDSGWLRFTGITARPMATSVRTNSGSMCSRAATNRISLVMIPALAYANWVTAPFTGSSRHGSRIRGSPLWMSMVAESSVYGPEVSYRSTCSPLLSSTRRNGTRTPSPMSRYSLCEPEIGPVVMVGWTERSSSAVITPSFPTPALPGQVHAVGGTWST